MPKFSYSIVVATYESSTTLSIGAVVGQLDNNTWDIIVPLMPAGLIESKGLSEIEIEYSNKFLDFLWNQIKARKFRYDLDADRLMKDFLDTLNDEYKEKSPSFSLTPLTPILASTFMLARESVLSSLPSYTFTNTDDSFYNQEEDSKDEVSNKLEGTVLRLVPELSPIHSHIFIDEFTPWKKLKKEFFATIFQIGDLADRILEIIATPFFDRLHARKEKAAMANPIYAKIQARRINGDGTYTLYSEENRLGREEEDTQREIMNKIKNSPRWESVLHYLISSPINRNARRIQRLFQRINRGWDDSDVWSMDTTMSKSIGAQLIHLANTTHGWPGTEEFQHPDEWTDLLHQHGQALLNYADKKFGSLEDDDRSLKEAREAFHWIADHFDSLWD